MKRATLLYLATYLALGGLGLLLVPDIALSLLLSNGIYGDIMPRVVGMFMLVLSYLISSFVRRSDFSYYLATIVARTFSSSSSRSSTSRARTDCSWSSKRSS